MALEVLVLMLGLAQQPPVPRPFPQPGGAQTSPSQPAPSKPAQPSAPASPAPSTVPPASTPPAAVQAPPNTTPPTEELLGVKVHPSAQYIGSYDAGRGQRFYIYGSTQSFLELVTYYRTLLNQRGELVFDAPATHEFDIGRFREETMAFPPGVTIKEYKSEISDGYPNPKPGGQPARFPTVIQIVPVPASDRR